MFFVVLCGTTEESHDLRSLGPSLVNEQEIIQRVSLVQGHTVNNIHCLALNDPKPNIFVLPNCKRCEN